MTGGLNRRAHAVFQRMHSCAERLNVAYRKLEVGAHLLDCGLEVSGGLAAGLELAAMCMAGLAEVKLSAGDVSLWRGPWIHVHTDRPVDACMLGQYAGWPVKHGSFFAMASGPMRVRRGREPLLKSLPESQAAGDTDPLAVGTLECDTIPGDDVIAQMASECQVQPRDLYLALAPTRSIAGCVQVVARSVETALHKLHELGFPLASVQSAAGMAPLPPATPDFALGIGRTNDAILYGAQVSLWIDEDDDRIAQAGARLPSVGSPDYGRPFAEVFAGYDFDFYKIDPGLFSPAEILLMNLRSGRSWRFGGVRQDLIARSFATET